jgi:hypothetical protein
MLSSAEIAAIDDWMFANRVRTRSDAIRQLVARGSENRLQHSELGSPEETISRIAERLGELAAGLSEARSHLEAVGKDFAATGSTVPTLVKRLRKANSKVDETADALNELRRYADQLVPDGKPKSP